LATTSRSAEPGRRTPIHDPNVIMFIYRMSGPVSPGPGGTEWLSGVARNDAVIKPRLRDEEFLPSP